MHILCYIVAGLTVIGGMVMFGELYPDRFTRIESPAVYDALLQSALYVLAAAIISAVLTATFGRISHLLEILVRQNRLEHSPAAHSPTSKKPTTTPSGLGVDVGIFKGTDGTYLVGDRTFKSEKDAKEYVDLIRRQTR